MALGHRDQTWWPCLHFLQKIGVAQARMWLPGTCIEALHRRTLSYVHNTGSALSLHLPHYA